MRNDVVLVSLHLEFVEQFLFVFFLYFHLLCRTISPHDITPGKPTDQFLVCLAIYNREAVDPTFCHLQEGNRNRAILYDTYDFLGTVFGDNPRFDIYLVNDMIDIMLSDDPGEFAFLNNRVTSMSRLLHQIKNILDTILG